MSSSTRVRSPVSPRRRRADRLLLTECALGLAAVLVSTGAFTAFYDGSTWLPSLAGAVLLGGAVAAAGVLGRRPAWLTALLTVIALVLLLHAVGYGGQSWYGLPTTESVPALGEGLWRSVPRSLAIGLPADVDGDLLALPLLLSGAAGAAVVALVLATRLVSALTLPAVLLFVAGMALTASAGGPGPFVTGGLLLLLLALLLVRSNRLSAAPDEGITAADADAVGIDLAARRRRSFRSRLTLGLPAVVVVAALAVVGGALLPVTGGRERVDPRSLYNAPFTLRSTLSPLVLVRPQVTAPEPQSLFTVRVDPDTDPSIGRVRVAALDRFDGALWTRSEQFEITGSRLPDLPDLPAADRVGLEIEIARLPQPFLPLIGEPERFSGTGFAFDRATGTAVGTRADVSGMSYSITALARPLDRSLREAEASRTAEFDRYTELPDTIPDWVGSVADQLVSREETALGQLMAIETALFRRAYSREAAPGHSYGALYGLFDNGDENDPHSAEQHASAFAVLARYKGYPARVAVGYLLDPGAVDDSGAYQVTSEHAHAWPEVHLVGHGWVPFEPSDVARNKESVLPRSPDVTLGSASGDQAREEALEETGTPASGRSGLAEVATRSAVIGLFVLGGVLVLLVAVATFKLLRRRWRAHRGPPAERVVAAWREVADRLIEVGLRVPRSRTGAEVASGLAGSAAAPVARHIEELAKTVAGAVFAYEDPDESAARRAWELERRISTDLRRILPLRVRLRSLVDPRPLWSGLPRRQRASVGSTPSVGSSPSRPHDRVG